MFRITVEVSTLNAQKVSNKDYETNRVSRYNASKTKNFVLEHFNMKDPDDDLVETMFV